MNTEQMRAWLLARYPKSERWAAKVKKMRPNQVFAVYRRMSTERKTYVPKQYRS
jgi:hypothetical protein